MKRILCIFIALFALLLAASQSVAQSGGGYELTWSTLDGGGATFGTGGSYSLGGTIGQPDAGIISGGTYTLIGGFWGGASVDYKIFLPVVLKSS